VYSGGHYPVKQKGLGIANTSPRQQGKATEHLAQFTTIPLPVFSRSWRREGVD
jgi:hypothetical protein